MRPISRVLFLSAIVTLIIVLWLMPKLNTAKDVRYTRIYENTDHKSSKEKVSVKEKNYNDTTSNANPKKNVDTKVKPKEKGEVKSSEKKKVKKEYLKESIETKYELKNINSKMYSRAIHFMPEEDLPIVEDTTVKIP